MIPNNNLSVLPWYTSIEQQNARKWWLYDRIYPLYTPGGFLLPFQIMREHREQYVPVEIMLDDEYDSGALTPAGAWVSYDGYGVSAYDINDISVVYFEDIPKPPVGYVSAVAKDSNNNLLGVFEPTFESDRYSGAWELPAGTTRLLVQVYSNIDETVIDGKTYKAELQLDPVESLELYNKAGEKLLDIDVADFPYSIKPFADLGYDVIVFGGSEQVFPAMANGPYYLKLSDGTDTWFSEIFTVVNDMQPYLKIEWWDIEDFTMDAGTIVYKYNGDTQFKNVLYLNSNIAKPEYVFEEEGESRDGYFFPIKQISEKRYRFSFFASEYLLDVMRFIRMADYAYIEKNGQRYSLDTFLITPEWEPNGDVAAVDAEFDTATVAKKIGLGYVRSQE